jgi:hypothetical protein
MPKPWVYLRCDQQGGEQDRTIGKRAGEGGGKHGF